MTQFKYSLLAGIYLLGTGSYSIVHAQTTVPSAIQESSAASQPSFGEAQKTWGDVRGQTRDLDDLIGQKKLQGVHDAALSLRDSVRELRFGWSALPSAQKDMADANIRKVDAVLDAMHESADHNDVKGTVEKQRTLHVLLDQIAEAFPKQTLALVGAVGAKGTVKDPYCRMTVDTATAAAKVNYGGQTYYFCSVKEAALFEKNPAPYVRLYDDLTFGKPKTYLVNVGANGKVVAGRETKLTFVVREQGQRAITTQFQTVHEKLMHLIAVSDDLSWFGHLHPEQAKDGRFYLEQKFPRDGHYFLFSDFTPLSGTNTIARSELSVGSGVTRSPQKLVADSVLFKEVDGVRVDLKPSEPLQAGKQVLLTYSLSRGGKPVTNMTPYLGAMGHLMAIAQDGKTAVHTHTVSSGSDPVTGLSVTEVMATPKGPTQTFKVELPQAGLFKVWAQFGVAGRTLTVPFTFDVKASQAGEKTVLAKAETPVAPAKSAAPKGAQKVTVTLPQGYTSGAATVRAGQPVALTFYLKSDAGCGNSVSVPAAKWAKTLRVGERATVVYTPKKSGTLGYECSMGHFKGTLVVK